MSAVSECPGIECWQALLSDTIEAAERDRYERHLESCSACQEQLRRIETDEDSLRSLAQRVGDPTATPVDATLVQVLERLHGAKTLPPNTSTEPAELYFLRPTAKPDVLGLLGDYEVLEVIGQGGMGVVLKAFEPRLHRLVAIKVLASALAGSATARRRFTREAQAAAAVCHDHIIAVHNVDAIDGLPYLVMQYVAGESLQERLDRTGPLEVTEIVRIGLQTASGLAAAHAQGLIHRDIKPANLLLEDGLARIKITDFGLARMADDVGLTQNGVVAGTPEYMAPEQARGEPVDHRADLFSLGSVLYACCTGAPPFRGSTALAVLSQVNEKEPAPIRSLNPDVPAWLEAFIVRLMAKEPAQRFQSAAEATALLEGYLTHLRQPGTIRPPPLPPSTGGNQPAGPPSLIGRTASWLMAILLIAVLLVLSVSLGLVQRLGGVAWLAAGGGPDAQSQSSLGGLYQDFRDKKPVLDHFFLMGTDWEEYIAYEREGLRVKLPATRKVQRAMRGIGLGTTLSVAGDFQITATYELLSAGTPVSSKEVAGLDLYIQRGPEGKRQARFGRFNTQQGSVYEMKDHPQAPDKVLRVPTAETKGQLRLARAGSLLLYLVKDDTTQGEFKELYQTEFGTEPLKFILYEVNPGSEATPVEARLIDLQIRGGLPSDESEETPREIAGLLGLMVALGMALFAGVWIALWLSRRRNGDTPVDLSAADEATNADAAPAFVSWSCSSCGKRLKARAMLAGKKVRCPQCGMVVTTPSILTQENPAGPSKGTAPAREE